MKSFYDAQMLENENGAVFCYRTGGMVAEERLYKGTVCAAGYNSAGYPLNVLSNCDTRLSPEAFDEPFAFSFEADGETVCRNMKLLSFSKSEKDGILTARAEFMSGVKPLKITENTVLDGTGMLTRYLEAENLSEKPVSLSGITLHGGGIERLDLNEVGWGERRSHEDVYSYSFFDSDDWGREGGLVTRALYTGETAVNVGFGANRFRHPALFVTNSITGDTVFVQAGWRAGMRFSLNYEAESLRGETKLSYKAEITGLKPLIVLAPGERFTFPEIHFAYVHGDADAASRECVKHLRRSVLNLEEANGDSLFVGGGMGAEHDMSIETSMSFARQLKEMGAEIFIIDAGWVCPPGKENEWHAYNGLNVPDKDRYPDNGLMKLRDYCHSIGMKFALWMEPERSGRLSGLKETRPGFFAKDKFGEESGGLIDMSNPDAVEWVEGEIARVVEEYGLDLLRIDYNIDIKEAFALRDCGTGIPECTALRHYSNVNGMYERLKKRFPEVIFENCSSGGGRTDTGHMKNFNHTWVSDNQKMPGSVEITNGMTLVLPPERVDRLFAGMGCHTRGELEAHLRNTMLTHMSLNVIAPACLEPNTQAMEFIKRSVKLYKEKIRPVMPQAFMYHHTPDKASAKKEGCRILELAAADKTKSFIAVFSEPCPGTAEKTVRPQGISAAKNYKVTTDNDGAEFTASGRQLVTCGIPVRLPSPLSSELIVIEEI